MTPYSITSQTSSRELINSTTDDYQPEVDSVNWESQMAKLVGLVGESPTNQTDEEAYTTPSQPYQAPAEAKTEQPLSSNPFAKLAVVGTATLAVVVVAGGFLSQIMGGNNQQPQQNSATLSQAETPAATIAPPQNLQQEVETLKTKLALAEQAQAVKLAQQNLRNGTRTVPQPAQTNTPVTRTTVTRTPVSQTVAQSTPAPRTVIVERVAQNPYPPAPIPVASSAIPQLPPPPLVQPNPVQTPSNPWEEWTRLAKLGSYGQANAVDQPTMAVSSPPPLEAPRPTTASNEEQPPQRSSSLISQAYPHSAKSLKVGTSAKAVLATAVFGETSRSGGNSGENENKNLFVVRLRQPLKGVDGAIALPANTELLTEVRSISEQGVVQLNIVKAILQENGNLVERDLPSNALTIRGGGGNPLLARQYPDRGGSIATMDAGLFVLGGVAKAAELFNRTESQVVVTSGGGTTVTSSNPQRNLTAGIVEGGLNSVVPQISQRNQQAIAQMMQQTNVWLLKAGTEVEIYVNQAIQL